MIRPDGPVAANTFNEGVFMDSSDMVLKDTMLRNMLGMRLVNIQGTSFCVTNINGTEEKFQLTNGFVPVASKDYNEVLYIISYNQSTQEVELGSYPSPNYSAPGTGSANVYRPFNNLDSGPFRTTAFGASSKPAIVDIEIQPDYDSSVNVLFTMLDKTPRLVNSKFRVVSDVSGNRTYEIMSARAGTVNSNSYTSASVDTETRQILSSDKILEIAFTSVSAGGKLKPGNYYYVFYYMTEDFNRTDIIGQSSMCQVAFGTDLDTIHGGNETQETGNKVTLGLTNIDTDFKYVKVYILYSSGQNTVFQQYLEMIDPIAITGEAMVFTHTGFEELAEVSPDDIQTEFSTIESAVTNTQIDNHYILGGIKERSYDFEPFRNAAANLRPTFAKKDVTTLTLPGYAAPANAYNYMGYFGQESYPFGIVYVLPGNKLSPVFPIKGRVFDGVASEATPIDQGNGVVTFPHSFDHPIVASQRPQAKYLKFDVGSIPTEVREQSIGFFFVRGERVPWLLTQGILVPTLRVANVEYITGGGGTDYYYDIYNTDGELSAYGHVPSPDGWLESFGIDEVGSSDDPIYVMDENFQRVQGFMPIPIYDMREISGDTNKVQNYSTAHWALLTGEGIVDEPAMVTSLLRDNIYIRQMQQGQFRVRGQVPVFEMNGFFGGHTSQPTGLLYEMESLSALPSNGFKEVDTLSYVRGESFQTGSEFISRVAQRFKLLNFGSSWRSFDVYQTYNSYFGIKMSDPLVNSSKGAGNPYHGNQRLTYPPFATGITADSHTYGPLYNNMNALVPAAFLANVYATNSRPAGTDLYPSVDNIAYKQITPRYTWAKAAAQSNVIDVFGGDCFITQVSRKLNQSGSRNPTASENAYQRSNMDSGITMTWWQESKYNLYLREDIQFDVSELVKRSFFPYQSRGNYDTWRKYRYPESQAYAKGYGEELPPRSHFAVPEDSPFIESDFFTRVVASERHIPNSFKNGYRSFSGVNFRDYDSSLGRIIRVLNHRNNLLVVFEHGVGFGPINQRIQTGGDGAGDIFVESKEVLPPKLTYISRDTGSQNFYSIVQARVDGADYTYGIDFQRKQIWEFSDKMTIISDQGFASFLELNPPVNARSGFEPEVGEVNFTTDNYTLAFKIRARQFYFMPYKPSFYTALGKKMLSFTDRFHMHGASNFTIYGNQTECFLEFVVNKELAADKVFDWIELVSNEVKPSRVEFYTQSGIPIKANTLVPAGCHQYSKVLDEIDPIMEEPRIEQRDKGWYIQIPPVSIYNPRNAEDDWEVDGRMRNKYMIVRLTYNTQSALQLVSVLTNYRYSYS